MGMESGNGNDQWKMPDEGRYIGYAQHCWTFLLKRSKLSDRVVPLQEIEALNKSWPIT